MLEESFELEIEFPIISPLKQNEKHRVIEEITSLISSKDNTMVSFDNSFYIDKRGYEFLETLHLIFEVTSPYITWAGLITGIIFYLKSRKGGKIWIKKKNGTKIPIDSSMSEDEVKNALERNEK